MTDLATADLASKESLEAAGFPAPPARQERFLNDVVQHRLSRMELGTRRWVVGGAGAALAAGFGAWSALGGDDNGALVAGAATASHLALAWIARSSQRSRSRTEDDSGEGCWRDDDGVLRPSLEPGERVLKQADADGEPRRFPRRAAAVVSMLWGLLLGGLPIAMMAGHEVTGGLLGAAAVSTFLGTWVFGRGALGLLGTGAVERLVLTDRRVVVLAAPGAALSVPLATMEHRPVVVGRDGGRATLALAERTLTNSRPMPGRGLIGIFDASDAEARAWAGACVDARRKKREADERAPKR